MFVSLNWLNEYVEINDFPVQELRKKMSAAGLSVERQQIVGEGIETIVIGEIIEKVAHPDSDHLWITQVRIGLRDEDILQIVTGAQNILVGQKVPVITPGNTLPDGHAIEVSKLRGIESQGMMCSAKELGLGEDHSGILILDADAPVGALFAAHYGFPDTVFDIEITPNRGDLLSMIGIAREVGVLVGRPIQLPFLKSLQTAGASKSLNLSVQIEDKRDCDRFAAVGFSGDFSTETPFQIKQRLLLAGMRPISLLVDISNYVMLEIGQPNHAYDARMVQNGEFFVRRAHFGEKLRLLDESEIELDVHNLVISDSEKIIGLAGIMGGDASKIVDDTQQIIVEAAHFDGVVIRKTTMSTQMRSEASHRFERRVDAALPVQALERFYALLHSASKVSLIGHLVDENHVHYEDREVILHSGLLHTYLGKELALNYVENILNSLGFDTLESTHSGEHGGWHIRVSVPTWRQADVSIEEDLIEEVARIYGYDNIEVSNPKGTIPAPMSTAFVQNKEQLLRHLVSRGWQELMTYSFNSEEQILASGYELNSAVKVHNPLTVDQSHLRMSLLPNLLQLVEKNSRMRNELAVFECSRVYHQKLYPVLPQAFVDESLEREHLACVYWDKQASFDKVYEHFIGEMAQICQLLDIPQITLRQDSTVVNASQTSVLYHPGRVAAIVWGDSVLGLVGELHPRYQEKLRMEGHVFIMEVDLADILQEERRSAAYSQFSLYPRSTESLSFVVHDRVNVGDMVTFIRGCDDRIKHVSTQLPYKGEGIPADAKVVTVEIELGKMDGSMNAQEVSTIRQVVISQMRDKFSAELR